MVGKRKGSDEQHSVTKLRRKKEQQNEPRLSTSGESSVSIDLL